MLGSVGGRLHAGARRRRRSALASAAETPADDSRCSARRLSGPEGSGDLGSAPECAVHAALRPAGRRGRPPPRRAIFCAAFWDVLRCAAALLSCAARVSWVACGLHRPLGDLEQPLAVLVMSDSSIERRSTMRSIVSCTASRAMRRTAVRRLRARRGSRTDLLLGRARGPFRGALRRALGGFDGAAPVSSMRVKSSVIEPSMARGRRSSRPCAPGRSSWPRSGAPARRANGGAVGAARLVHLLAQRMQQPFQRAGRRLGEPGGFERVLELGHPAGDSPSGVPPAPGPARPSRPASRRVSSGSRPQMSEDLREPCPQDRTRPRLRDRASRRERLRPPRWVGSPARLRRCAPPWPSARRVRPPSSPARPSALPHRGHGRVFRRGGRCPPAASRAPSGARCRRSAGKSPDSRSNARRSPAASRSAGRSRPAVRLPAAPSRARRYRRAATGCERQPQGRRAPLAYRRGRGRGCGGCRRAAGRAPTLPRAAPRTGRSWWARTAGLHRSPRFPGEPSGARESA